jgi:hypothetical protein
MTTILFPPLELVIESHAEVEIAARLFNAVSLVGHQLHVGPALQFFSHFGHGESLDQKIKMAGGTLILNYLSSER